MQKYDHIVVERNSPGIKIGKKENNTGQRASDTRGISFENVKVSKNNVLRSENNGFFVIMKAFDYTRPLIAAPAVGLSRTATEHSIFMCEDPDFI